MSSACWVRFAMRRLHASLTIARPRSFLVVRHFTKQKSEVVISRGELVQIGGGFRIGEILEASGATLREVGATNKTTLRDYERALGSDTAIILKATSQQFFYERFRCITNDLGTGRPRAKKTHSAGGRSGKRCCRCDGKIRLIRTRTNGVGNFARRAPTSFVSAATNFWVARRRESSQANDVLFLP